MVENVSQLICLLTIRYCLCFHYFSSRVSLRTTNHYHYQGESLRKAPISLAPVKRKLPAEGCKFNSLKMLLLIENSCYVFTFKNFLHQKVDWVKSCVKVKLGKQMTKKTQFLPPWPCKLSKVFAPTSSLYEK
jgi:hypothetical protein